MMLVAEAVKSVSNFTLAKDARCVYEKNVRFWQQLHSIFVVKSK